MQQRAAECSRGLQSATEESRILETVEETRVGVLMPRGEVGLQASSGDERRAAVWEELTQLGQQIGDGWQSEWTAAELLSEMRR